MQELQELGGLKNIKAELPDWPVSDDTVLHLATAEGLATGELSHIKTFCSTWFFLCCTSCWNRGADWIDLTAAVHASSRAPQKKVKSNFQPCLDLALY